MPKPTTYKFCFGPWNLSEGQDPYGPPTRPVQSFDWKLEQLKGLGYDAMMFHDDDAVPDVDNKSDAALKAEAKALKRKLDDAGIVAEIVAPRLWFDPRTVDGAYTSNDPKCRRYAIERSLRCLDIAAHLDCDLIVLWLAREGSYIRESKNARRCFDYLVQAVDKMLAHHPKMRIAIEPKPNEPMDLAYVPTIGHALALAQLTADPKRVGCLIETAHALLAGLDPADEIDFACAFGKLWSLHLNDQNGLKFDQDRAFGSVNLRRAFDQVLVLDDHRFYEKGVVGLDVKALRTQPADLALKHLINSRDTFLWLVERVRSLDRDVVRQCIEARDYEELDRLILSHLMGR